MSETWLLPSLQPVATRLIPLAIWLILIWLAETFFSLPNQSRFRHGLVNLGIVAVNGLLLFFTLGYLSLWVCSHAPQWPHWILGALVGFLGLDLFGYLWHRANHAFSFLWRFHAVHHSDSAMDVTSSGRFHFMELGLAGLARLPILFLLGVSPEVLVVYETTLVAVSMFHHSTINLGTWDQALRLFIVTPQIHSIHHSNNTEHHGFNFASVLSIWDRLFCTLFWSETRITYGLPGFEKNAEQSVWKLLIFPFKRKTALPNKLNPSSTNSVFVPDAPFVSQ